MTEKNPIQFIRNRTRGIIFGRTRLGEMVNSIYDNYIFLKYSFSTNHHKSQQNFKAYLTKQYHIIEKGLSLPNPRKNFGKLKILDLINKTEKYLKLFGNDDLVGTIKKCLSEYLIKNDSLAQDDYEFFTRISNFARDLKPFFEGGTKQMSRTQILQATDIDFYNFVKSRTSIRDFDTNSIKKKDVEKALEIAKHTPSVCNRQSWKVHFYDDRTLMDTLLKLQAGNSGFTNSISALLVLTTDTQAFTRLEKNQVFVDGGLFGMNLLLALHSVGIGACSLNTCLPYTTEIKIKRIGNIKESERLIMMIGIGYIKEDFKSAYSKKKSIEDILTIH